MKWYMYNETGLIVLRKCYCHVSFRVVFQNVLAWPVISRIVYCKYVKRFYADCIVFFSVIIIIIIIIIAACTGQAPFFVLKASDNSICREVSLENESFFSLF